MEINPRYLSNSAFTLDLAALSPAAKTLATNLAIASRILSLYGHDDMNQGQVSARIPGAGEFYIKNAQVGFDEATPECSTLESLDHTKISNRDAPPELPLHQGIYSVRSDVNAIVHSHSPYALLMGATDLDIKPISHEGAWLLGDVRRYTKTSNTVISIDIGRGVADALGRASVVLLRNHGSVIVGKSLREATVRALMLERACMLQLIMRSTNNLFHESSQSDVTAKRGYIFSDTSIRSYWEYLKRQVLRQNDEARIW